MARAARLSEQRDIAARASSVGVDKGPVRIITGSGHLSQKSLNRLTGVSDKNADSEIEDAISPNRLPASGKSSGSYSLVCTLLGAPCSSVIFEMLAFSIYFSSAVLPPCCISNLLTKYYLELPEMFVRSFNCGNFKESSELTFWLTLGEHTS